MKKINCIIIDDEPSSQNVLEQFVESVDYLVLKKVCNHAIEAKKVLEEEKIDLLFLDINMPLISGLEFYKSLKEPPLVIFTTAYSEYAVEGFEVNATDYLLKPFSFDRFLVAVNKAKDILTQNGDKLLLKADKKLHLINFDDILFINSLGDYVKVYHNSNFLITYSKLSSLIERLPKNKFIQVHKSYVINFQKIDVIEGNHILIQENKIPIGQKYKSNFTNKLNSY
ncbi:response regulator transcription factor [uncultured Tenacibaculum sp.]|uniref:LytR/AlgR family response regulator transcription factor n=1 Tax=uncultured Tenacibaculum sp. TaxID=174713 RepID=UPI0026249709|nr:response regulator transcription factor [uncultured Tenacibaculum sp.]